MANDDSYHIDKTQWKSKEILDKVDIWFYWINKLVIFLEGWKINMIVLSWEGTFISLEVKELKKKSGDVVFMVLDLSYTSCLF